MDIRHHGVGVVFEKIGKLGSEYILWNVGTHHFEAIFGYMGCPWVSGDNQEYNKLPAN